MQKCVENSESFRVYVSSSDDQDEGDCCEFVDALAAISPRPATVVPWHFARTGAMHSNQLVSES